MLTTASGMMAAFSKGTPALDIAVLPKAEPEGLEKSLETSGSSHAQEPDSPHLLRRLRPGRDRRGEHRNREHDEQITAP